VTLVSIITPSYNCGRFLAKNIESVLNQTYRNIEHWIIDGGSTDDTLKILKQYEDEVNYVSERDNGVAEAMNKGFRLSRGDILVILNADDYLVKTAVEEAVSLLEKKPEVGVVYGNSYYVDENGRVLFKNYKAAFNPEWVICGRLTIPQSSAFFRRSALKLAGKLDEDINYCADFNLWLRMICRGVKMRYVNRFWSYYRISTLSINYGNARGEEERRKVIKRLCQLHDYKDKILPLKKKALSYIYLREARRHFELSSPVKALKCISKSLKLYPYPKDVMGTVLGHLI